MARAEFYRQQFIPDKLELALKDVEKACELEPDNGYAHYRKGLILLDLRRYSQASQSFNTADHDVDERTHTILEFYYAWAAGLSAYYQGDDPNQARKYFLGAKSGLGELPTDLKQEYNISYIAELLEAYLQLIPLDGRLKNILSEPAKLSERTAELDGLRESFSGMFKLSTGILVEIDTLLEAKLNICALLLPLKHPQAIKPEDSEKIIANINSGLEYLNYEHAPELIRIITENRQNLEVNKPFTSELTQAGNMADGVLTSTTFSVGSVKIAEITEKMSGLTQILEEAEVEETLDPKTGQYIQTKRRLKFRFVSETEFAPPGFGKISRKAPPLVKPNLVNIKEAIMKLRHDAGVIIPPVAKEVLMSFVRNNLAVKIDIFAKDKWLQIGEFNPSQLPGFEHTQGEEPLMAWHFLVAFALTAPNGHPAPEGETKDDTRKKKNAFYKQVDRLNEKLQTLLGITDKAIIRDTTTGNYKSVIRLFASKHSTIE